MKHLNLHPLLEHYRKEIEATLKPVIHITPMIGETLLWGSKFGGKPYFPKDFQYPVSKTSGNSLMLLAQINFEEIPHIEPFPKKGILQFYISDDYKIEDKDLWGMNPSDLANQNNFRIIYYADIIRDENKLITDFSFLPSFNFGAHKEYKLQFKKDIQAITPADYRYDEMFNRDEIRILIKKNGYKLPTIGIGSSDQLGGYHYSQNDHDPKYYYFDDRPATLLLQISGTETTTFTWGDGGTACFFITEQDLKNLDFSNVIYHWDCT